MVLEKKKGAEGVLFIAIIGLGVGIIGWNLPSNVTTTAQAGTWTFSKSGTVLTASLEGVGTRKSQTLTGTIFRTDTLVSSVVTQALSGDTIDFAGIKLLINNTITISTTKSFSIKNGAFYVGKAGVTILSMSGFSKASFFLSDMFFDVENQTSVGGSTMTIAGLNPGSFFNDFVVNGSSVIPSYASFSFDVTVLSAVENNWKFIFVCGGPTSNNPVISFHDQGNVATNFYMSTLCGGDYAVDLVDVQQVMADSVFLNYGVGVDVLDGAVGVGNEVSNCIFDNTLAAGNGIQTESAGHNAIYASNTFINSAFTFLSDSVLLNNHLPHISPTVITVGASPFTYTNNDGVEEMVYISGGTLTLVQLDTVTVFTVAGDITLRVNEFGTVKITYTVAPTMKKQY